MQTPTKELETVLAWAKARLAGGSQPPWAWYQLMKLHETTEKLLATPMAEMEHPPQARHLRLVSSTPDEETLSG